LVATLAAIETLAKGIEMKRAARYFALAAVVAAAVGMVLLSTGASSEPSPDELSEITNVIDEWLAADTASWPADEIEETKLSAESMALIDDYQARAASELGTKEFAEASTFSWSGFLQEMREVDSLVMLDMEHKILTLKYAGESGTKDAVVSVQVWYGETQGALDADGATVKKIRRIDTTPIIEFCVRQVDGSWKISNMRYVERSADADSVAYGPYTPHEQTQVSGEWKVL